MMLHVLRYRRVERDGRISGWYVTSPGTLADLVEELRIIEKRYTIAAYEISRAEAGD